MKYLGKTSDSKIIQEDLKYSVPSQRGKIRQYLLEEQKGFCAYTERHVRENDSCHIEHFDDRRKGTLADSYDNWYAVLPWSNERKPKIDKCLPVLAPGSAAVAARIRFDDSGLFVAVNEEDVEAKNLLKLIGINKPEVYRDRAKHVERIRSLTELCGADDALFFRKMAEHRDNLSYASALECVLGISLAELL
jgi:hypothetical protein